MKKSWKILIIILVILLIVSVVIFYFIYKLNRPIGPDGELYRYICIFQPNDIPCTSQDDCGLKTNYQFCNETISRCQPYLYTNNRDECLNAKEIFENFYD